MSIHIYIYVYKINWDNTLEYDYVATIILQQQKLRENKKIIIYLSDIES